MAGGRGLALLNSEISAIEKRVPDYLAVQEITNFRKLFKNYFKKNIKTNYANRLLTEVKT